MTLSYRVCLIVCYSDYYWVVQCLVIFFNMLVLITSEYSDESSYSGSFLFKNSTYKSLSIMFLVLYGIEIMIESIAKGLYNDEYAYLIDFNNCANFTIFMIAICLSSYQFYVILIIRVIFLLSFLFKLSIFKQSNFLLNTYF